jgi:ribosomal-protein-alanine N-acetyltransferase
MELLHTERLDLVPMSLAHVEAVLAEQRDALARMVDAALPVGWPSREVVSRAFHSIERIRAAPEERLWGDRFVVARDGGPRRVVGSVVFHGRPGEDGVAEIAYGIEPGSQGKGYATEATRACVAWALAQPSVRAVAAVTTPWHSASIRVLERLGMKRTGVRDHETLGELVLFEVRKEAERLAVGG